MRVLLALFCLIALINFGCKQPADPLAFDRIVSLAYSDLTITNPLDSVDHKAKKKIEFKFLKIKRDTLKTDSCDHRMDCYIRVM